MAASFGPSWSLGGRWYRQARKAIVREHLFFGRAAEFLPVAWTSGLGRLSPNRVNEPAACFLLRPEIFMDSDSGKVPNKCMGGFNTDQPHNEDKQTRFTRQHATAQGQRPRRPIEQNPQWQRNVRRPSRSEAFKRVPLGDPLDFLFHTSATGSASSRQPRGIHTGKASGTRRPR
jgi:hypothetical protein